MEWLQEALLHLEREDTTIAAHIPKVIQAVEQSLKVGVVVLLCLVPRHSNCASQYLATTIEGDSKMRCYTSFACPTIRMLLQQDAGDSYSSDQLKNAKKMSMMLRSLL